MPAVKAGRSPELIVRTWVCHHDGSEWAGESVKWTGHSSCGVDTWLINDVNVNVTVPYSPASRR